MATTEMHVPTSLPVMEVSEETTESTAIVATDMVTDLVEDITETTPSLVKEEAPEGLTASVMKGAALESLDSYSQESGALVAGGHLDTAFTSTVTVPVSSPELLPSLLVDMSPSSPASSHSTSSTELASAHSMSTFMSAPESPKVVQDTFCSPIQQARQTTNIPRTSVVIEFSQWLEALFIALEYKYIYKRGRRTASRFKFSHYTWYYTRYYTCPLDQVVEELDQRHLDGVSFSRLFMVDDGCELVFPSSVYEIMNSFSQTTYRVGLEGTPHLQDERIPLMVWQSCAFTVHSIVVSAREAEKALFGSLSSRQNDCLSTFIRFCGVVGSNLWEPKVIRSHSLKLLSTVLEVDTANPSILEVDMFGVLVSLTYSLPSLFNGEGPAPIPSCNIQDNHILRLMFLAHVTQLLFSMAHSLPTCTKPDFCHCPPAKDCRPLLDLIEVVNSVKTSSSTEESTVPTIDPMAVWQEVMEQSIGFLRCSALFYHYLSGVSAPTDLTCLLPADQEFICLTKYLDIPNSPEQLLDSRYSLILVKKWISHPTVPAILSREGPSLNFLTTVPQLITLPEEYSDLFKRIHVFSCPFSMRGNSSNPSLCLVCGMVVCSQSKCCQSELDGVTVGAAMAHSYKCSAGMCRCVTLQGRINTTLYLGSGLFLQLKECKLVMFCGMTRGCYVSPPYLDQYGEPDQGLKRGKPLTLSTER